MGYKNLMTRAQWTCLMWHRMAAMKIPSQKLNYLLWSAARIFNANTTCPACGEQKTQVCRRKYLVTALYRCPSCEVMFRVPKPNAEETVAFYQGDYKQGFTTDCPLPEELAKLKSIVFAGTEKDYSRYIQVLQAVGVQPGSSVFDFGCSWGYGSWQFAQAGYKVYSFEISRPRARYAAENMDCTICLPEEVPEKVDCFFSAHVIEHLLNPRSLWEKAQSILKPGGRVVVFLPNGDPARENSHAEFHKMWGQVHPLLLSPLALQKMGEHYGFTVDCYASPFNPDEIAQKLPNKNNGVEFVALGS